MKQAMCDTFLQAVEQENFKNGALRGQITEDTSFEEAINVFLASSAVTDSEKEQYFRPMRSLMAAMDEEEERNPEYPGKLLDNHHMSELCAVFTRDMQSQYSGGAGSYNAPMLVQTVKPGLDVVQTYTVDDHGNRKDYADGRYGVDPGAPEWYKKMQADRMKPFVDGVKKDEGESAGVHDTHAEPHESSDDRELHIRVHAPGVHGNGMPRSRFGTVTYSTTAPMSRSTSTEQAATDDFGAAFKNNAKRFFL